MELVRDHLEVHASGPYLGQFQLGINEGDFKLAMDILMDLYTDSIGSVVRELASNARDAMNAAGRHSTPIEVTLPTLLSPQLIIKDRGNGMTQEFLTNTYSKLLSSTKRDDNDNIGGYGIGSKSPLGYTDSYTLSTRVDGTELHIYVSRSGGFTTMGTNATNEDNGTTVTVPVRGSNCKAFANAVDCLRYMDPPAVINGVPMLKEEVLLEGSNWFMAHKDTPYTTEPCILIGPIPYSLDIHKLGILTGPALCIAQARFMRLRFPIGALTVTPSRETLRYDEHTITTIKEALASVYAPAMHAVKEMLEACEWEIDAKAISQQYSLGSWWRHSNRANKYQDNTNLPSSEKWYCYTWSSYKSAVTCEKLTYYPSNGAEVYLHDSPPRSRMRINDYIAGKTNKDFRLLVGPVDSEVLGENLFPTQLLSSLPDVGIGVDDELEYDTPKPDRKVLEKLARGSLRAKKWSLTEISRDKTLLYTHTIDTTIPLSGEGYYLCMSAGKVFHPDLIRDFNACNIENMLNILGIPNQPLYIVPPQAITRLGPGWKDLVTSTHEYVLPWLSWLKQLYLAPSLPMSIYSLTSTDYTRYGISGYVLEYLKLANEASKFTAPNHNTFWWWVLDLYQNHLQCLWNDIPQVHPDPLAELKYLVVKMYPLLEAYKVESTAMNLYLPILGTAYDHQDGWYSSCKLTEGHPTHTMDGKELMIHYYQRYGDVRRYYDRHGQ